MMKNTGIYAMKIRSPYPFSENIPGKARDERAADNAVNRIIEMNIASFFIILFMTIYFNR